jgi:hypothetical protein
MSLTQSTKKHDAGKIAGPWNCPNTVEVQLVWSMPNGKTATGKLHGTYATVPANMQNLVNGLFSSLSSAWQSNLATYMHTGTVFTGCNARDMASFANPVYFSTGTAVPGTGTGAALPESNCIVLTEQIQGRGRGMKGRMYLGGWVQSVDVTTGGISTAVQTAINAMGTAWMSALSGQGLTACVAQAPRAAYLGYTGTSHPARGAPGNGTHIPVTAYVCRDLIWDTQRRRIQP